MKLKWFVALGLSLSPSWAKDAPEVAKARESFYALQNTASPAVEDAESCIALQKAAFGPTKKQDRNALQYRQGYCELRKALLTRSHDDFAQAAKDLSASALGLKDDAPVVIRALAAIAMIEGGRNSEPKTDVVSSLVAATEKLDCTGTELVGKAVCQSVVSASHLWLGYLAFQHRQWKEAAGEFQEVPASPWNPFLAGEEKLQAGDWKEALANFDKAENAPDGAAASQWLAPKLETGEIAARIGEAEFRAGAYSRSVKSMDRAIADGPANPRWLLLRARAKDKAGQRVEAMADYELAANAATMGPGHTDGAESFYRGILLYQRKNLFAAGREFTLALERDLGTVPKTDVEAWRALTRLGANPCKTLDPQLETLSANSDITFPKEEAGEVILDCRVKNASTLEDLLKADAQLRARYGKDVPDDLRQRMSEAFLRQGIAAEEASDRDRAFQSYRKSLDWKPQSAKARFNLGAMYIDDRKFVEAEAEYRKLIAADPNDHEVQYWLAESILGQKPGAEGKAEACSLLKSAMQMADAEKRTVAAAVASVADCPK